MSAQKGRLSDGFHRTILYFMGALLLVAGIIISMNSNRSDIAEKGNYSKITAENEVVLHIIEADPDHISLVTINDNIVRSGKSGINGGFFWENQLLSIAAMDGIPVNGEQGQYGSGWFNAKYARGTLVYDRVTKALDVQRVASVHDLNIADSTQFWAQGGVSMNLKDDSRWYQQAVIEEALPFAEDKRLRSGIVYDDSGVIYLVVSSSKCTSEQFRKAIKENIAVGKLEEGIFLDGDGSSQLLIHDIELSGDDRSVVQMIAVNEE